MAARRRQHVCSGEEEAPDACTPSAAAVVPSPLTGRRTVVRRVPEEADSTEPGATPGESATFSLRRCFRCQHDRSIPASSQAGPCSVQPLMREAVALRRSGSVGRSGAWLRHGRSPSSHPQPAGTSPLSPPPCYLGDVQGQGPRGSGRRRSRMAGERRIDPDRLHLGDRNPPRTRRRGPLPWPKQLSPIDSWICSACSSIAGGASARSRRRVCGCNEGQSAATSRPSAASATRWKDPRRTSARAGDSTPRDRSRSSRSHDGSPLALPRPPAPRAIAGTYVWDGARTAFEKIRACTPPPCPRSTSSTTFLQTTLGVGDYTARGRTVDALMIGIEDRTVTRIAYHSLRTRPHRKYDVHPYGLVYHKGSLYLIAWSKHHEELRHFKVDRIRSAEADNADKFDRPPTSTSPPTCRTPSECSAPPEQRTVRIRFAASSRNTSRSAAGTPARKSRKKRTARSDGVRTRGPP